MFASKDTLLTRPSGGYNIARSVRLRSSATGYFSRTPATTTNRQIWTWSGWVKRGELGANEATLFSSRVSSTYTQFSFRNSGSSTPNQFLLQSRTGASEEITLVTTQVFRDPSAWYHIVVAVDTTQATSTNRVKIYSNGSQITSFSTSTYPPQNLNTMVNFAQAHAIGNDASGGSLFDGYLTEINFVDGQQLTPSSFGETDSITGVWKPKAYSGTYGTNGFELNFSDNSNNTAATIGKDYSGNGNNWTPNNISVTAGTTYDSMVDSPTVGSLSSNYAVFNPLIPASYQTTLNGNLRSQSNTSTDSGSAFSTITTGNTGLWYAEFTANTSTAGSYPIIGTWDTSLALPSGNGGSYTVGATGSTAHAGYMSSGNKLVNGAITAFGASIATGDVVGVAIDCTNGAIYFSKNNTWQNSGVPTSGSSKTGAAATWTGGAKDFYMGVSSYTSGNGADANFGQRPFSYTPPTGFVALNTYNLPASTIKNGAAYMAATTYTGTGASLTVANTVGSASFQPDWVWVKQRNGTAFHALFDSVRGATKVIQSNTTTAEQTFSTALTAFTSNGFTTGSSTDTNQSGQSYVAWNWKAGTTSASNTNGTITSTVSVGATQGFSVVTYTGTGANATVGHGLGVAPNLIIVRNRTASAQNWQVYSSVTGATKRLFLDLTDAAQTVSTVWNNTAPTSTVFSIGTVTDVNGNTNNFVAYCFSAVAGYSAFGSYTGNGSADGVFVYTGFRPRLIMLKRTDSAGNWTIYDSSRNPYNAGSYPLYPNLSNAEDASTDHFDWLSNGFKMRSTNQNTSSGTFIYMAFAQNPFSKSLAV